MTGERGRGVLAEWARADSMRLALLLMMAGVAAAQPAPTGKKLIIAIYAPNAPFASGSDRFSYVQRLAQQITSVTGLAAEGKAFARSSDLETAIKAKQVDFAVLDGVYLAGRGAPYPVLGISTIGGETQPKWALFAPGVPDIKSLAGKRLSLARSSGRDDDFIGNALFDGEIQPKKFFGSKVEAPDLAGALTALNLKKAEAVFAPESEAKGMKALFEAGRVPNPAFCDVSGQPSDVVSKVKAAVLAYSAGSVLDGWKASDASPYRSLASRMGTRTRRPFFAEPSPVKLEDLDVLVPPSLEPAQPDLRAQFWAPTP
jgi:hypothetical protein